MKAQNPLPIKVTTKKKDGRLYAYVYQGADKMPLKGTNFPLNTPMKDVLTWANAPTNTGL